MARNSILVADDDVALLQALAVRLRSEGFQIQLSQDPHKALEMACQATPDLLILGIDTPARDGISLPERLRSKRELHGTPVIFVTRKAPERMNAGAAQLGAFAIIHKPFDAATLVAAVREALGLAVRAAETRGV